MNQTVYDPVVKRLVAETRQDWIKTEYDRVNAACREGGPLFKELLKSDLSLYRKAEELIWEAGYNYTVEATQRSKAWLND